MRRRLKRWMSKRRRERKRRKSRESRRRTKRKGEEVSALTHHRAPGA